MGLGGWGQALRKRHNAETGLLPVTYANDYRRLAALGRGLVASVLAGLDLSWLSARSSLTYALGNTEISTLSPAHPLVTSHTSLILPGQS